MASLVALRSLHAPHTFLGRIGAISSSALRATARAFIARRTSTKTHCPPPYVAEPVMSPTSIYWILHVR